MNRTNFLSRKFFTKLIVLLIVFGFICTSVAAQSMQNAQELRVNNFISENLRPGQVIWYSVRATQAGILIVETLGNTDTFLEVYDSRQNLITSDDDGGYDTNAKIEIIVNAGETYFFKLRGYHSSTSGQFRIFADLKPMPQMTELRIGSFFSGNITSDDDGGENTNAKINIVCKSGKTYYFKLTGYGDTSGPYRIMAGINPFPIPTQLNPGTFRDGYITPGGEYWYSVRASAAGVIVVETTGSTDTFLDVYDFSFDWITSDDDGGDGFNARIEIPAEANRVYIFRLRGYSTSESGSYRIFASIR
jgi:hypothetical protein